MIAGRLYEGLAGAGYNVFLDSEAKFKLHDLEKIVAQTDVFVLILSAGVFDSQWCLQGKKINVSLFFTNSQEIRSAISHKRDTVIIRDYTYEIPKEFPPEMKDIETLILTTPIITWMAEFNSPCVDILEKKYLGAPNKVIDRIHMWYTASKKQEIEQEKYLNLAGWGGSSISMFLSG